MLGNFSEFSESETKIQINGRGECIYFVYIFSDLVAEKTGQKENPPRFALRAGSVTNLLPAMKM